MGGKNGRNSTRRNGVILKRLNELEAENLQLAETSRVLGEQVESLKAVNLIQCQRLGQEELLRIRIAELERELQKDEAQ